MPPAAGPIIGAIAAGTLAGLSTTGIVIGSLKLTGLSAGLVVGVTSLAGGAATRRLAPKEGSSR